VREGVRITATPRIGKRIEGWGLGIGDWGLGIGDFLNLNRQSEIAKRGKRNSRISSIPNPQPPIPLVVAFKSQRP
jgi:hypothetical protein